LTHELYVRLAQAREILRECGWQQHTMGDAQDGYCLTGAIRRTGLDGLHIVLRRLVALHIDEPMVELYNDMKLNNRFEAIQTLDFTPTTAMLEQAYGPNYEAVVGLIRQLAHLTDEQSDALLSTCSEAQHDAQLRALSAVKTHPVTHQYVDVVLEDVHAELAWSGECWAVIDQVAVTQLAWDALNRGELSISIDDVAPANALFARAIGLDKMETA
jgi:hypothetical protein